MEGFKILGKTLLPGGTKFDFDFLEILESKNFVFCPTLLIPLEVNGTGFKLMM